ncbi:MAG TPA: hypothetical protein VFT95_16690 [Micromonosporaceae bacterium]|nr:hypothetical protein [Micromonosporaceae bacterium]
MMSTYDAELALALGRQRGLELQAEADRHRLARALRRDGQHRAPWWRRAGRHRAAAHRGSPVLP